MRPTGTPIPRRGRDGTFAIDKGVAIPHGYRNSLREGIRRTLERMDVGDSFAPDCSVTAIRDAVSGTEYKVTIRRMTDDTIRVWRTK